MGVHSRCKARRVFGRSGPENVFGRSGPENGSLNRPVSGTIARLDEATSALDSESEILIQRALWRFMQDRTALMVAHRLSTVARMDQLVVLDRGQIAEKGTHQELLRRNGIYARVWQHQSGGFLDDNDATTAMLAEAPRLSA